MPRFFFQLAWGSWLVLAFLGLSWSGVKAQQGSSAATARMWIYPDSATAFNPRVPCVAPVEDGKQGKRMDIETVFKYDLAPYLTFPNGGKVSVQLRDNLRREAKKLISFSDGSRQLAIQVSRASEGRIPALVLSAGDQKLQEVRFAKPLGSAWSRVDFQWDAQQATVSVDGVVAGRFDLATRFHPTSMELQSYAVSGLHVEGAGTFDLDWSVGYAGALMPQSPVNQSSGRVFGFDAYFVSQDSSLRDYPMVQIFNGGKEACTVSLDFDLHSEVRHLDREWNQKIKVEAGSSAMVPIQFPFSLVSDVYHLNVKSQGLAKELDQIKHFSFVEKRSEPAGPPKYGLHDSSRAAFGFWPDVMPIHIAHTYAYWGYIQGPIWIKDFNGGWGIDPQTPSEEWNWDKRLNWVIGQGLIPYVSVQSTPYLPWMRERDYAPEQMKPHAWGPAGGFPKLTLYRKFLKALTERYKGKVKLYEVENEPNANSIPPDDYVAISKAVFETVHATDPEAQVYGMCVTGDFVPWMSGVFKAGVAGAMDGISVHTYVSPSTPEQANLLGKLSEVRSLIKATGQDMPLVNSETGTYVSPREVVDQPISNERLAELIRLGTANYMVPGGWPNRSVTEMDGGVSLVRNVVYNFLAGGKFFVFFSWNPGWPSAAWWTRENAGSPEGFSIISATKEGLRTPSLYTLALGVLTAQTEGVIPLSGQPVDQNGVLGGLFKKQGGGQVAVLWSALGKRSVILKTSDRKPEIVSMLGEARAVSEGTGEATSLHAIELTETPIYIHLKQAGFELAPSPVIGMQQTAQEGDTYRARFTLVNRYAMDWSGNVEFNTRTGWKMQPKTLPFSLKPGGRSVMDLACSAPSEAKRGVQAIEGTVRLPDGSLFTFPLSITVRANVAAARLPESFELSDMGAKEMPGSVLKIDQLDQVVIGRPPLLASLQEEKYWKGPAELSAVVQIGYNARGLVVVARVHDANPRWPTTWPGVGGSCVEFFFDFRPYDGGFGRSVYEKGVYQMALRPRLVDDQEVTVWDITSRLGTLPDIMTTGGRSGKESYWVAMQIPWKSLPASLAKGGTFGFDVAIDGPHAKSAGRKNQLIWCGTANNSIDASNFGLVTIPPADSGKK